MNSSVLAMITRAAGHVGDVGLQRGRVHRDEHVRTVAGREDVVVGEVQLERRDARQRARGSADLGREVGQRREVVAEGGGLGGEPVAGELHAVAGVTGEPDDHPVLLHDAGMVDGGVGGRHVLVIPRVGCKYSLRG